MFDHFRLSFCWDEEKIGKGGLELKMTSLLVKSDESHVNTRIATTYVLTYSNIVEFTFDRMVTNRQKEELYSCDVHLQANISKNDRICSLLYVIRKPLDYSPPLIC